MVDEIVTFPNFILIGILFFIALYFGRKRKWVLMVIFFVITIIVHKLIYGTTIIG